MARYHEENETAQQGGAPFNGEQFEEAQYSEAEPLEQEAQFEEADQYNPEVTDFEGTNLRKLLDFLIQEIERAPVKRDRCLLNRQMCMDVVADIRECLPKAVRAAFRVWDEREAILSSAQTTADLKIKRADARADKAIEDAELQARRTLDDAQTRADNLLEEARNRARAMVEQSEIMRRAHEEADKICDEARAEANECRMGAKRYTEELLRSLERDVAATLEAVHLSQKNFSGQ